MASVRQAKTNFTTGELSPALFGRSDLRSYGNGARRLRNVFIQPTGGVYRRPGLRHVDILDGEARLIAFEFNTEQTYLLVLGAGRLTVYRDDLAVATLTGPWTAAMLPQIAFTQNADTLLLLHPEMVPQRITRTSHVDWTIAPWSLAAAPFHRFAADGLTLAPSATTGSITLAASAPFFLPQHAGVELRLGGKRLLVTAIGSATSASATVIEPLAGTAATADWEEAALSAARGWPVCACFHQDRLVLGGSRDLPNRLWLSRSGDLFNFDLGTGLDDEAIDFGLLSDQVNAIRAVFSGRHLQVFTSGAEWMVSGDPLTPGNIQLNRQTRIGSPVDRIVPPVDVEGSTVFVARGGDQVALFSYTDVDAAYNSEDLSLVAPHLIDSPVSMAFDQRERLLHVVMADGALGTVTLYRSEQVIAWTRQETAGQFLAVAEIDGTVWLAVRRDGSVRLERFDAALALDAALTGSAATPQDEWLGLSHLEGRRVSVLGDGAHAGEFTVAAGKVTLDEPALAVAIGLAFTHLVEPLPVELTSAAGSRAAPVRLVSASFRLLDTAALSVDLGRGAQPVPFRRLDTALLDAPPAPFTGDVTLRGLGWRRDTLQPLWRIEGDAPLPMTLLSVTTDVRMID
jgi:hypothetical protein